MFMGHGVLFQYIYTICDHILSTQTFIISLCWEDSKFSLLAISKQSINCCQAQLSYSAIEHRKNMECLMCHCHTGALLISVSFQFQYLCCQSSMGHSILFIKQKWVDSDNSGNEDNHSCSPFCTQFLCKATCVVCVKALCGQDMLVCYSLGGSQH